MNLKKLLFCSGHFRCLLAELSGPLDIAGVAPAHHSGLPPDCPLRPALQTNLTGSSWKRQTGQLGPTIELGHGGQAYQGNVVLVAPGSSFIVEDEVVLIDLKVLGRAAKVLQKPPSVLHTWGLGRSELVLLLVW